MEQYEERNKGALSRNKRKTKPAHPDYTGDVNIDGVEYWMSGWIQDGKNGKFLSLSLRPKEVKASSVGRRLSSVIV
jgi:hypothetical protein